MLILRAVNMSMHEIKIFLQFTKTQPMKKSYIYFLFISGIFLLSLMPNAGHRNSGQAPLGRTGAPGESSCAACHGGGNYTGESFFVLGDNAQAEYVPGETYTISFEADYDAPRYGFSVTALDADEMPAGDFALLDEDNTSFGVGGNDRQYVGHKNADATNSWSFEWTAPDDASGEVTFYYVVNAANADNGTGGDMIETGSSSFAAAEEDEETFVLTLLTDPENAGSVSGDGAYEEGETVNVSVEAHDGYSFDGWFDDLGEHVSEVPDFEYVMPAEDVTLVAHFDADAYTLTFIIQDENATEIPDAIITLNGEAFDSGVYVFEDLTPGDYDYVVTRDGYGSEEGSATIADQDETIVVTLMTDDTNACDLLIAEMKLFPNPAHSLLNLEFAGIMEAELSLFNLQGRAVYATRVQSNKHQINVADLPSGIYYLRISAEDAVHTLPVQIKH